ncbi:hypothetical protein [Enterococcus hirae]|nr:hypothetical protein [Enterococcus hirae]
MVKIMGKDTGHVYHSCQSQTEANEWVLTKKIVEPLVLLILPGKEGII